MKFFSKQEVNHGRQTELDLARGFAGFLLIIVHVGLYLGSDIDTGLWVFCDIIGSEPCAPVLMVLMGICTGYSRSQNPNQIFKHGLILFIMGYVLNFFRSGLPLILLGNINDWASLQGFFVVDILQFAGLSFMLIAVLRKLKFSNIIIFAISIGMVIIDQFIMFPTDIPWNSELLTGIVNLFCPVTGYSCFPLLTWFAFPAFGLIFGDMLRHCTNKNRLYGVLMPVSFCCTAYVYYKFYSLYPDYTSYYWGNNFYYMGVVNVLLTIMIICFILSFWFFAGKILPDIIKTGLNFLSVNLTKYYAISWILITILVQMQTICGWRFGTWETIGIMAVMIILCAGLTKLWLPIKRKIRKILTTPAA